MAGFTSNENSAVGISREYVSSQPAFLSDEIYCFRKRNHIESYQVAFLVRRDRDLMNLLNKEIAAFSEAGLVAKWIRDNKRTKPPDPDGSSEIYYNMEHIQALFIFNIGLGWFLSTGLLLIEKLTYSKNRFLIKLHLLTCLEFLVDSEKHNA